MFGLTCRFMAIATQWLFSYSRVSLWLMNTTLPILYSFRRCPYAMRACLGIALLATQDPQGLLNTDLVQADRLIQQNDHEFKHWLDRYKYSDRYPEQSQLEYRHQGEQFLQVLENLLAENAYLLGNSISKADIAIMPFVRQFAHVDRDTFYALPYPKLQQWLKHWLEHPLFELIMKKHQPWQEGNKSVIFG